MKPLKGLTVVIMRTSQTRLLDLDLESRALLAVRTSQTPLLGSQARLVFIAGVLDGPSAHPARMKMGYAEHAQRKQVAALAFS